MLLFTMMKLVVHYLLLITLFSLSASNDFSYRNDNPDIKVLATAGNGVSSIVLKNGQGSYSKNDDFETFFFGKKLSPFDLPKTINLNYSVKPKIYIIALINFTLGARSPPFVFS